MFIIAIPKTMPILYFSDYMQFIISTYQYCVKYIDVYSLIFLRIVWVNKWHDEELLLPDRFSKRRNGDKQGQKLIMRAHKGRLNVRSSPGKETVFCMTFSD
jgi:hypothetical protein